MTTRKKLIIGIIISITVLLIVNEIIYLSKDTTFQIRKFNVSKSNASTAEYVTDYNAMTVDIAIVNMTIEGLNKYPALVGAIDSANKTTEYYSQYTVSTYDWKKINDFIKSKYKNLSYGDVSPCIKFGQMYGNTCYQFIFIKQN